MPLRRTRTKKPPLVEHIDAVFEQNGRRAMQFYDLAAALWPERDSHRHATQGGPPGCYMILSATLRRHRFHEHWKRPGYRLVWPRSRDQIAGLA